MSSFTEPGEGSGFPALRCSSLESPCRGEWEACRRPLTLRDPRHVWARAGGCLVPPALPKDSTLTLELSESYINQNLEEIQARPFPRFRARQLLSCCSAEALGFSMRP